MDHVPAVRRVGTYYLAALAAANDHIIRSGAAVPPPPDDAEGVETPYFESRTTALSWLEGERANILACIRRANALARYDLVIRLAAAMAPFLRQAGPWDQAIGLHRTAAEAARHTGDQWALAGALIELGVIRRWSPRVATPTPPRPAAHGTRRTAGRTPPGSSGAASAGPDADGIPGKASWDKLHVPHPATAEDETEKKTVTLSQSLADTAERTMMTFAESFLGLLLATRTTALVDLSTLGAAAVSTMPAALAALKSTAGTLLGRLGTASWLPFKHDPAS
ncbi:hypothetical protein ACQ4WX_22165 [Streptomyces lasalocidi]